MAVPMTPVNFVLQQGNGQTFLSWDIVSGATSYQIQRSVNGVTYANLATSSVNNYLDTTVTINTLYYYQIASINSAGTSSYTSPQQVIPTLTGEMCLSQIRFLAQDAADMIGSNFITSSTWNIYINQSSFELYDLLTDTFEDYFLVPQPLLLVSDGALNSFPLPNGQNYISAYTADIPAPMFYKLRGVDNNIGGNSNGSVTLRKYQFINRNKYTWQNLATGYPWLDNLQYRVMDNRIYFIPNPPMNQSLYIWYIPRLPQLLQETDVLDGVSGWTEYVIIDAAIKAKRKQDLDISILAAQKMAIIKRIEDAAANRDVGEPERISQTRSGRNGDYGYGGSYGGGFN